MKKQILLLLFGTFGFSPLSNATYTVVAVDDGMKQIGGAGASCTGGGRLSDIFFSQNPKAAVLVAQSEWPYDIWGKLNDLLRGEEKPYRSQRWEGLTSTEIIDKIAKKEFVENFQKRQYGIVMLGQPPLSYTGSEINADLADSRNGSVGNFQYAMQGNVIYPGTIPQMEESFKNEGCDLVDKLMRTLEAAGKNGKGDHRCYDEAQGDQKRGPNDSAFLIVEEIGLDISYYNHFRVHLEINGPRYEDAVPKLRKLYDTWRKDNPCRRRI